MHYQLYFFSIYYLRGIAPFRDGQAVGNGYGNKITRRDNFGMNEVPCDGFAPFNHYLVCDELVEGTNNESKNQLNI